MADHSSIEWTDATWNPTRGCSRVSPGCGGPGHAGGCYAETIAARFSNPGQPFHGFAERDRSGSKWTGKVALAPDMLELPLRWRKPRRIFVNSMSDLFHEALPLFDIAIIYGVAMAAHYLRGHTLQILTKRADRMRELLHSDEFWELANSTADSEIMERIDPLDRRCNDARARFDGHGPSAPPPGIWLGVSVEDQQRADERVPLLLETPARVRFLSCEPLLGPVNLARAFFVGEEGGFDFVYSRSNMINWVICGGESGSKARPMEIEWARSLRDQCVAAGARFFMKQLGGRIDKRDSLHAFPEDLRLREFPA